MNIVRRKIIQNGPSSLTISLPSKWVKKYNLNKGDDVDLVEDNDYLIIKPVNNRNDVKSLEVSFIGLKEETRKDLLLAFQKKGYDEIKINFESEDILKEIYSFLHDRSLGFDIILQESNYVIIKNISNPQNGDFENLFRRTFRLIIEYATKILPILKNGDDVTRTCLLYELSLNKISNYCKRIIISENKQIASFMYAIIENLEDIAYNLTNMLEKIDNDDLNLSEELILLYEDIIEELMNVHTLYYKFSFENYDKLISLSKSISNKIFKLHDNIFIKNIQEKIDKILELSLIINV